MTRLVVLPANPGQRAGVELAVRSDVRRLALGDHDVVVVQDTENRTGRPDAVVLPRPPRLSLARGLNVLRRRPSLEPRARDLAALGPSGSFAEVFCGETTYYRVARALHPTTPMTVRMHHCYTLLRERSLECPARLDLVFRYNLEVFSRIEALIARDDNARIAFITDVEQAFWERRFGGDQERHELWPVVSGRVRPARAPTVARLAWIGGVTSHKRHAVRHLVEEVMPALHARQPTVRLHLFGRGVNSFHDPSAGVTAHGVHEGEGLPFQGDALFVNPDLLGGGVKMKVDTFLSEGVAFISTPRGMEGQAAPGDSEHVLVCPIDRWASSIERYFQHRGLLARDARRSE